MNREKPKIVFVGGGSVKWMPHLIADASLTPALHNASFQVVDIDRSAAELMAAYGNLFFEAAGLDGTFRPVVVEPPRGTDGYDDAAFADALKGADVVAITISTGGLKAWDTDRALPEQYGIYQTVADTVGPGGWSRALRNIPVFAALGRIIERYAPQALVINYSNPMAVLTGVFHLLTSLTCVGICHGIVEMPVLFKALFELPDESGIKMSYGGVNHFFWMLDFTINGRNGYAMLEDRLNRRSLNDVVAELPLKEHGWFMRPKHITSELYDFYGYLPYVGDRHIAEFFPRYLTSRDSAEHYTPGKRSTHEDRVRWYGERRREVEAATSHKSFPKRERSRDTAVDIMEAWLTDRDFVDVLNLPNNGQIANLPDGAIVETPGLMNGNGAQALCVGSLPDPVAALVMPHALNQMQILRAGLDGDLEGALAALANDPLCSHLRYGEIREMGLRLLRANQGYLPQFFES